MPHWRDCLDPAAPSGRYLPWKEVRHATGLSRTTAWRLQRRDDFPAAYPISPGRVGYLESELEAWKAFRRLQPGAVRPDSVADTHTSQLGPAASRRLESEPGASPPQRQVASRPPSRRRASSTGERRQMTFDF